MLCPSTPAAPSLASTLNQAASSVAGAYTLSIRLYQCPPLTPFSSADTMRSVHTEASTHDHLVRVSAPCLALAGTLGALCASGPDISHPPSCPPSLGAALLSALSAAPSRLRYYAGSDPCRASPARQVSPVHPRCLPDIPSPPTLVHPDVTCLSPRASGRVVATQASPQMSRLADTRRRIGFVILRAARSPPAALHPASGPPIQRLDPRRRSCLRLHMR